MITFIINGFRFNVYRNIYEYGDGYGDAGGADGDGFGDGYLGVGDGNGDGFKMQKVNV